MDGLRKGVAELYEDGDFTDFTIRCGQHTFSVHKMVICAQSRYFRPACSEQFAEGSKKSIDLKASGSDHDDDGCDDAEAINLMVHFFYYADYEAPALSDLPTTQKVTKPAVKTSYKTGFFPADARKVGKKSKSMPSQSDEEDDESVVPSDGNVVMHAKVFAAATKYQVFSLQALASSKFKAAVKLSWSHHGFVETARIAYTTTPEDVRALRDIAALTLHSHDSLLDSARIQGQMLEVQSLPFKLLRMARCKTAVVVPVDAEGLKCEACGQAPFFVQCPDCGGEFFGCCSDSCQCINY
ncbi:hypothetical protein LTR78_003128 [Recurvomyces mirabilis]|uniref:BTB domain-containing protein n=1 Tax=Recurvomyces mirabilis TaxID=574656 RepID=A0AAE1C3X9_9PEZI|nr:hypothetical protein LTR78_003128 [Recurvomyces mirabilis]KAK5157050.1 hypothetical protein LTS14_004568 [Recurvomyces mirabilis]